MALVPSCNERIKVKEIMCPVWLLRIVLSSYYLTTFVIPCLIIIEHTLKQQYDALLTREFETFYNFVKLNYLYFRISMS